MAKVFIEETTLTAIGDAIRGKEGTTELIPVPDMATRISAIQGGGGGGSFHDIIPEEDCILTGPCNSLCSSTNYLKGWLLNNYPNELSTDKITTASALFSGNASLEEIPFNLDFTNAYGTNFQVNNMFLNCNNLKKLPTVTYTPNPSATWMTNNTSSIFRGCHRLTEIPDDWVDFLVYLVEHPMGNTNQIGNTMFTECYSLRSIPASILKAYGEFNSRSSSYGIYSSGFQDCTGLDEIVGLGCNSYSKPTNTLTVTSNLFSYTFSNCGRCKNITFELDSNGLPQVRSWKTQTIDLSSNVGYASSNSTVLGYSTFTTNNWVKDDATYQAFKNDPDWWTQNVSYSRYNHDSAVNTINSLPDTSAYLASAGGTNTIKFKGASGEKTDAGAINTMTAEEIAVATAKGWTVTLV